MTRFEEIINLSIKRVLAQGCRSVNSDDGSSCVYHNEEGQGCAIGVLITDDHYKKGMEGVSIGSSNHFNHEVRVILLEALEKSTVYEYKEEELDTLQYLQNCHDEARGGNFILDFSCRINDAVSCGDLPRTCLEGLQ
jgi:hypothetical protein